MRTRRPLFIAVCCLIVLVSRPTVITAAALNATDGQPIGFNDTAGSLASIVASVEVPVLEPVCNETIEFSCGNQSSVTCIDRQVHCNGFYDCSDGLDEQDCYFERCPKPSHVLCADKSSCIAPVLICDQVYNCRDHSDEAGCTNARDCQEKGKFYCDDKQCIDSGLRCDGVIDCESGQDEENCSCDKERFQCANSRCVSFESRCNGVDDCDDGSDEWSCYRIDKNDVAQKYNSTSDFWLPICYEPDEALYMGHEVCRQLGYGYATNVSFINIKQPHFADGCDQGLTVVCQQYHVPLRSSGINALQPQDIPSTLQIYTSQSGPSENGTSCKGQIISPIWLLTSYECLRTFDTLKNLTIFDNETLIAKVDHVVIHPHTSLFRSIYIRDYDYALLRLEEGIDFNSTGLLPIPLPKRKVDLRGITCFVPLSPHSELAMTLIDNSLCNERQHYNNSISQRHLCTEPNHYPLDALVQSTPLICLSSEYCWFLAGILTYAHNTSYLPHPVVFSNVHEILNFIDDVLGLRQRNVDHDPQVYVIYVPTEPPTTTVSSSLNATSEIPSNVTDSGNTTEANLTSTNVAIAPEVATSSSQATTESEIMPNVNLTTVPSTEFEDSFTTTTGPETPLEGRSFVTSSVQVEITTVEPLTTAASTENVNAFNPSTEAPIDALNETKVPEGRSMNVPISDEIEIGAMVEVPIEEVPPTDKALTSFDTTTLSSLTTIPENINESLRNDYDNLVPSLNATANMDTIDSNYTSTDELTYSDYNTNTTNLLLNSTDDYSSPLIETSRAAVNATSLNGNASLPVE